MTNAYCSDTFVAECYKSIISDYQGGDMATKSIRISEQLAFQAQAAGALQHRSAPNQLEYWATLGKMISSKINIEDALAILQGLKTIKIETLPSAPVDPDSVFDRLESDRAKGFTDKPVTGAPFFYEASLSRPGSIDKVDTKTGLRTTGQFKNGVFEAVDA